MTLGQLIEAVKEQGLFYDKEQIKYKYVRFDFGTAIPTNFNSYRGDYAKLALGYRLTGYDRKSENKANPIMDNEFLEMLEDTVGETFEGWKGGEFAMELDTEIYVNNPGDSSGTGISKVISDSIYLIICTEYIGH